MNHKEVISILNGLVETCARGEEVFRGAAENIRNSEFRRLFNIFAQQRAQFISELLAEIHRLGGDVSARRSQSTTAPGKTIPFGRSSTGSDVRDEVSIILGCQREEEGAVNDYQEALKADLPLDVQYVVKRQYIDIKDAYDRIRILQRAA
jgi:uncharacterized protein (TIGR02284 family)